MQPEIYITEAQESDAEDAAFVLRQLQTYNDQHAKLPFDRKRIHLYARDANGKILGAIFSKLTFHTHNIEILWVDEALRGQGTGKQLLIQAETIARAADAVWSIVETTSFQARPFYERCGYEVFAELKDSPIGDTNYWLKKRLATD